MPLVVLRGHIESDQEGKMQLLEEVIGIAAATFFAANSMFGGPAVAAMSENTAQAMISDEVIECLEAADNSYVPSAKAEDIIGVTVGAAFEAVVISKECDERTWYRAQIPLKKEYQKLVWDYCRERGLDYFDMLALIALESNFDEKCSSTNGRYQGFFQISKVHWASLSEQLNTANNPLDGAVNINWGTAMYSWILKDERVTNLEGKAKRDAALSIFNRGAGGYDRKGLATTYLKVFYNRRELIASYFEQE